MNWTYQEDIVIVINGQTLPARKYADRSGMSDVTNIEQPFS
jgi:hypothetical protein